MHVLQRLGAFLNITQSHDIVRRYFVVNGFDGALTILGMMTGFRVSGEEDMTVIVSSCFGAAVALAVSGVTSAYLSEAAERQKALTELEGAMVANLRYTTHARAARAIPFLIAAINGLAPLLFALMIIAPLWLYNLRWMTLLPPLVAAISVALLIIFFLGVFLGRISGAFWLWSGIRTLCIAVLTMLAILLLGI